MYLNSRSLTRNTLSPGPDVLEVEERLLRIAICNPQGVHHTTTDVSKRRTGTIRATGILGVSDGSPRRRRRARSDSFLPRAWWSYKQALCPARCRAKLSPSGLRLHSDIAQHRDTTAHSNVLGLPVKLDVPVRSAFVQPKVTGRTKPPCTTPSDGPTRAIRRPSFVLPSERQLPVGQEGSPQLLSCWVAHLHLEWEKRNRQA